jgi:signal transduction histidine kinase
MRVCAHVCVCVCARVYVCVCVRVRAFVSARPNMTSPSPRTGHELRNPLHGVCAGVEALRDGTLSAAETNDELKAIAEGVALMVNITNDMTDLQKLRAGQFVVHVSPTSVRHVLESCILAVQPSLQRASDIQLVYDDNSMPNQVCCVCCICRHRRRRRRRPPPPPPPPLLLLLLLLLLLPGVVMEYAHCRHSRAWPRSGPMRCACVRS